MKLQDREGTVRWSVPLHGLGRLSLLLILLLLFGYAGWNREFARIGVVVGGIPLFVTELCLLAVLALWCAEIMLGRAAVILTPVIFVTIAVCGWATVVAAWTWDGRSVLFVSRDLTMAYYGMFAVAGAWVLRQRSSARLVSRTVVLGALAGTLSLWIRFALDPSIIRYGHLGHSALGFFALLSAVLLVRQENLFPWPRSVRVLAVAALLIQVGASGYRTLVLVGAVLILMGLFGDSWRRFRKHARQLAWAGTIVLAVTTSVIAIMWFAARTYVEMLVTVGARFVLLIAEGIGAEPSWWFRVGAWQEAVALLAASPLFGVAPGAPIQLYDATSCLVITLENLNCGNPHNTYLAFALRFGLPGLILVLITIGAAVARLIYKRPRKQCDDSVEVFSLTIVGLAVYGLTSLMLESPFLCVPFWIAVGGLGAGNPLSHGAEEDRLPRSPT